MTLTPSGLAMLVMLILGFIGMIFVLIFDKPKRDKPATGDEKGGSRPS